MKSVDSERFYFTKFTKKQQETDRTNGHCGQHLFEIASLSQPPGQNILMNFLMSVHKNSKGKSLDYKKKTTKNQEQID